MKKGKLFDIKRLPMDMARIVCTPLLLLFRMKRMTAEGERYTNCIRGGAILAANHTSMLDPFLVGVAVWYRRLHFLVAEDVMKGGLRRVLLTGVGGIRIDRRSADIEAINRSVEVLKEGRLLSVFPEGGIGQSGEMGALKSGTVLIALRAGVPVIPMRLLPVKHWYSRRRVVIGEPIDPAEHIKGKFPSMEDIERVTGLLGKEMRRLGEKVQ